MLSYYLAIHENLLKTLNYVATIPLTYFTCWQVLKKIPLGDVERIQFRSFKSVNRTLNDNCSVDFSEIPYRIHIGGSFFIVIKIFSLKKNIFSLPTKKLSRFKHKNAVRQLVFVINS
jgi:hypothetical protein